MISIKYFKLCKVLWRDQTKALFILKKSTPRQTSLGQELYPPRLHHNSNSNKEQSRQPIAVYSEAPHGSPRAFFSSEQQQRQHGFLHMPMAHFSWECMPIILGSPLWRDLTRVLSIIQYSTLTQTYLGRNRTVAVCPAGGHSNKTLIAVYLEPLQF